MKEQKRIDELIGNTLRNLAMEPEQASFEKVMEKMRAKKRRRLAWVLVLPFAMVLVMLGVWFTTLASDKKEISAHSFSAPVDADSKLKKTEHVAENPPTHSPISSGESRSPAANAEIKIARKGSSSTVRKNASLSSAEQHTIAPAMDSVSATPGGFIASKLPVQVLTDTGRSISPKQIYSSTDENIKTNSMVVSDSAGSPKTLPARPLDTTGKLVDAIPAKTIEVTRTIHFFAGLSYMPQVGMFVISSNNVAGYSQPVSSEYAKQRRQQQKIRMNQAFGLKLGIVYKEKWEFQTGTGIEIFRDVERPQMVTPTSNSSQFASNNAYNYDASQKSEIENEFRYIWFAVEAARVYRPLKFLKMKTGLSLYAGQLYNVHAILLDPRLNYTYSDDEKQFNGWQMTLHLKQGFIEDLGKRIQLQLCPGIYYSPTSMFKSDYLIRQQCIGLEVEGLLLFKF